MGFDAGFLAALVAEMEPKIVGSRVDKIHQPTRDVFVLHLKGATREKLLIAADPAAPRLYLTEGAPENPEKPPMLCMLLRKHLLGARLSKLRQLPMERAVELTFDCTDEMGFPVEKKLAVELMGRTCNLYLLGPDGRILDCLRRVGLDAAAKRQALPGLYYQPPDPVEKRNPADMTGEEFDELLQSPGPDRLADRLMDRLGGVSPLVCREAALAAAGDVDARLSGVAGDGLGEGLAAFFRQVPTPWYTLRPDGSVGQFSWLPLRQYGPAQKAASFSALLDRAYGERGARDAIHQKSQAVRKTVTNLCQRLNRKLAVQEKELAEAKDRERLRQLGDIVTANLHRAVKGQKVLEAEDFYDEKMPIISIPLSPLLSPQQNAAKFYKDYARKKNAEKELTHQLALGREELHYLQSVLEELDRAQTEQELEEIRQELRAGGYLRQESGKKRLRQKPTAPLRFVTAEGYAVYVGRNNRQNDELTFRLARKDDLWLHAQKVPGSHVILVCAGAEPPDEAITQAAELAAGHSQAAQGQNVPVDVTRVKAIKKPASGRPGMVIYHTYRTVFVNPKTTI